MASRTKIELSAELLRTLHRIHRQLADVQGQIGRGPRQVKAGEAMVAKAAAQAEHAKDLLTKTRVASDEKQLQLRTRESRIEDLKTKLNTAASNREYSMLKEQIAADVQANAVLSDEILEQLEQIDVLQGAAQKAKDEYEKQQKEQSQRVQEVESRAVVLADELEGVKKQLATAEAKIPAAAKADYDRLIASKAEDALAPVEQDSCGGCYQTLTTQVINQLQLSQMVLCPNCNAFLYLPEDTRVR